jgi:C4-dicarboxylate transporter DctQ subunit
MNVLKALEKGLLALERSAIVLILSMMILLAFLQVILRNFFSVGFLWADPLLRHAVLWVGFIGASIATRNEKHINIDLVTRYASPRVTNLLRIVTNLFAALVTALLAKAGWVFLQSEQLTADKLLTIGSADLPAWWFEIIIPAGFALISFRFLLKAADHVVRAFRRQETKEPNLHVPTIVP